MIIDHMCYYMLYYLSNQADLTLHLPPGTQVSDLKWLSVWCRAFTVNFGDLVADFTLGGEGSEAEAESESEPETVSKHTN